MENGQFNLIKSLLVLSSAKCYDKTGLQKSSEISLNSSSVLPSSHVKKCLFSTNENTENTHSYDISKCINMYWNCMIDDLL